MNFAPICGMNHEIHWGLTEGRPRINIVLPKGRGAKIDRALIKMPSCTMLDSYASGIKIVDSYDLDTLRYFRVDSEHLLPDPTVEAVKNMAAKTHEVVNRILAG